MLYLMYICLLCNCSDNRILSINIIGIFILILNNQFQKYILFLSKIKQISRKEFQMKEVQSPKKPLLYYYVIIAAVIILFNLILTPTLMKKQITDVDYGTFMTMINDKNIGKVEIDDSQILFTDKEFCKYHPIFFIFFNSYTNKYKHKIKVSVYRTSLNIPSKNNIGSRKRLPILHLIYFYLIWFSIYRRRYIYSAVISSSRQFFTWNICDCKFTQRTIFN